MAELEDVMKEPGIEEEKGFTDVMEVQKIKEGKEPE